MKFAAIDIGSNAVRLLFANVFITNGEAVFKKESLIRIPLRLGEEAFLDGFVSQSKIEKLGKTMLAFRNLIEATDVVHYKACATAALREASNGQEVVEKVFAASGVKIEIIEGSQEANIIYANHIAQQLDASKAYLYIDVGGGSTELSFFANNQLVKAISFPIGTLKLLNNQVEESDWQPMKKTVLDFKKTYKSIAGIGTGGNINKLYKLYGDTVQGLINYKQLREAYEHLEGFTYAERVTILGLKPDRADVILPAAEIFLNIMRWADIDTIFVPKIGLSDGIIHLLYEEHRKKQAFLKA
ncbi:MAG: exopolyphosphatase [Chitinophagales bacterium]|nr:exopolyphosphatase [Chitinophagales bacterium]